jgi:nucleoside-diphosphate-sugar epimerase
MSFFFYNILKAVDLTDIISGDHEQNKLVINTSMVHIDDMARAHIFILEYPEAKGR